VNTAGKQQRSPVEAGMQASLSPAKFFETMNAYQRSSALKAAIELDLFTAIDDGAETVSGLAKRIGAPERGIRALSDFLVVMGFLNKAMEPEVRYTLTSDSGMFLTKKSPAYVGGATIFLGSTFVTDAFKDLASVVRAGGPAHGKNVDAELPAWVDFAHGMAPVMYPAAEQTAKLIPSQSEIKVLDIAAGHGLFGISVARLNPKAQVVALDWPSVLAVAKVNAERFGVADRLTVLPGNALEVSFGSGFDVVLATNLLHHWDRATNNRFLKKVHAALVPGGKIVIVEFAPNDDRVSPPIAASFVMNMFANTPGGDAYTVSEHCEMLRDAGFVACEAHALEPTPQTAIVAAKK
jgi:2-polyprenyl-3-methyl-5-hydroxy-6-metoxy-1,4-benzoquinol methylase